MITSEGDVADGTCSDGGHSHSNPLRPLVFDNGQLEYPGDSNPDPLIVSGFSDAELNVAPYNQALVVHNQPQVSGVYQFESTATAPSRYEFIRGFTRTTAKAVGLIFLRVPNLRQLPDPSE